ncbi:MAG: TonB-dependent receptor [Sulfurospirillaceae bacterium]|nr:TonB-dependent receptor [Sulfurospirillaceae bacterium]
MVKIKYLLIASALAPAMLFSDAINLDTISVTATKIKRGTKEVSQSIAVVDKKTIEDKNILNISEALENIPGVNAESSTNSPSPRLIIRGAGLKARYGVREIMVMKDGIPMTDPDSFTRFDFIDMQDIDSIEVQKGPGSINAVNTTGGVIQLITKSVFAKGKNSIKLGIGDDGQRNVHISLRKALGENDFTSFYFSHRKIDNSWRDNNNFDTTQGTLKYGHYFKDDSSLETELSYTESNMQIPPSMTASEFQIFKETGEEHDTSYQWQNSERNSKILSANAKYEKQIKDWTFKPRFYFNHWGHFHPVTGIINDSNNNNVYGTDLETDYNHRLFSNKATLVFGVTAKQDRTRGAKKYEYADYETAVATSWPFAPYISKTLSNVEGSLASTEDSTSSLYGLYFMETFSPLKPLSVDLSARIDNISFNINGDEITAYDYATKNYVPGIGLYNIDKAYTLFSSKLGSTYAISDYTNVYASIAMANQAPATSELIDNNNLNKSKSVNYEVGIKTRKENFSYDLAIYQNDVSDEIIQIKDANGNSVYDNAGKTRKRGIELNGNYQANHELSFGFSYAYSDFRYVNFEEKVGSTFVSRNGNYLPYIPKNLYSLNVTYRMNNGFKARIQTKSWGSYYMDNANTQKYEGYNFVTDLMIGYVWKKTQSIQLNVQNIFDKHYAMEATKDVYGNETYKAAAPRSFMVTYNYKF